MRIQSPHRSASVILLSALLVLIVAIMPSCKRPAPTVPPTTTQTVVVTIFPLYDLIQELAGPTVQVKLLLPGSVSPHGYALTPADVQSLDKADLVVAVGGGLDNWALDAIDDRTSAGTVRVVQLVPDAPDEQAEDEHDQGHGSVNPHQWLVPKRMAELVGNVSKEMQALYPNQAAAFRDREFDVQMMLAELDLAYEELIANVPDRRVVLFHDGFGPLAERYGLDVVATVLDVDTFAAVPARIELVRNAVVDEGVRAVFSEPQFDAGSISGIVGNTAVRVLDPIGGPGVKGYESYEALMRTNLEALIAGMKDNITSASGDDGG